MTFSDELKDEIIQTLYVKWTTREGTTVPDTENLRLGNDAVALEATVLYADLSDSTILVDQYKPEFSGKIYKIYLHAAAKIVRSEGGVITAYDGDRIMAVFIGDSKNTSAVKTALKINYAVTKILNPAIKERNHEETYQIKHAIGIDTSPLFIVRTGVRGANDLVWVGRAANYAAKLASLNYQSSALYLTEDVFDVIHKSVKISSDGEKMWEPLDWTSMDNKRIYRSTWLWNINA